MKTATVHLTDEQAQRLDEEAGRLGLPAEVLIGHAIDAYFGLDSNGHRPGTEDIAERAHEQDVMEDFPFAWLVGLGESRPPVNAADIEEFLAREWTAAIEEDSFGGTRSTRLRAGQDETGEVSDLPSDDSPK
jgi:hypothetical protein